jgi:RNA polymerase sigma-70 factor (ECF subfamily)
MRRNHVTKKRDSDTTGFCCADDETLARVLVAARTSAGGIAQRVVRNWHTAEDVVQEALLRAVVAQDHLQQIDNLEAWFHGVVRNLAVDRVRREVREREIMEALSTAALFDDVVTHQRTEALEQEELRDLIREAISQLSEHNRRVVDLFYLKNQTLKQVADCLGVSPNVVKQRLFRARDMLKQTLLALSMDADSVHTLKPRKAIIMKTKQQIAHPTHFIPPGWHAFGHTDRYSIRLDSDCRRTGASSLTLKAEHNEADQTAGLMQRFPAGPWRGRRLLARLWVKGAGLDESGFHAFLEAHDRQDVGYNVVWPKCGATFDWRALVTVIDVPDADGLLTVGFQLIGHGQVWVDRLELEESPVSALPADVRHSITWPGLMNLDFCDAAKVLPATGRMLGLAPGWFQVGFGPHDRIYSRDHKVFQTGVASACIDHRQIVPTPGLSRLYQRVPVAKSWQGRHLRMRGWVKTCEAERAGLWLRTDTENACTSIDDMKARPIEGTRDWSAYELVAPITPEVTHIGFGGLLHGKGAIWLDRFEFEAIGHDVPCTTMRLTPDPFQPRTSQVNDASLNLDFSEAVH